MPEAARAEGAKEPLEVEAVVREALPNALYRVELSGGTRAQLVAHVAGESSLLRLRPGLGLVVAGQRSKRADPTMHGFLS